MGQCYLNIDGGFGIFGTIGFCIKIKDNRTEVFHMLSSDDFPAYAYKEKDSLIMRLEVPCKNTRIILSEIPNVKDRQIIYGCVEFESEKLLFFEWNYRRKIKSQKRK
ncbi:MAG: hypothetical protein HC854_00165, partial [Flavobacterium sp.]|nr:hypothetical protein [Flavobacterium sp.]